MAMENMCCVFISCQFTNMWIKAAVLLAEVPEILVKGSQSNFYLKVLLILRVEPLLVLATLPVVLKLISVNKRQIFFMN